jgi:hypothetical protein
MKSPKSLLLILAVLVFLVPSYGRNFRNGKASQKKTPGGSTWTIESVNGYSITVKNGTTSASYTINNFTEITSEGQDIKVDDLKAGMMADIIPDATDPGLADQIMVANAAPTPTPTPGHGKKKNS